MGQPLLDQGADALDIMPPTPEELPPDTDAPFEVPPPALVASLQRLESNAAAHFEPRADAFVVTSAVAAAAG